jgi:hypothetical protein
MLAEDPRREFAPLHADAVLEFAGDIRGDDRCSILERQLPLDDDLDSRQHPQVETGVDERAAEAHVQLSRKKAAQSVSPEYQPLPARPTDVPSRDHVIHRPTFPIGQCSNSVYDGSDRGLGFTARDAAAV